MGLYSLDATNVKTPECGNYWVAPNATVTGNIVIEENASIWFNSVLRGDNEEIRLGAGSNIQEACVLHTDPGFPMHIEPDCTIGHMVMLHGCTVKSGSLVGIGAIVLNGAVIGEECLIGAGALIPEGKVIPPRSLVMGTPGRVVREMTDKDIAGIRRSVDTYQRNWRRFKDGMKPQAE